MSNVVNYKYNIENIDFSEGFFVKTALDTLGENLFQHYKNSETPDVVTTSGIVQNEVAFKASHSNRFYIGAYRTGWSSIDGNNRVETFFAVFYNYPDGGVPETQYIDITFPKGYVGKRPDLQHDLTIRRTVNSSSFWVPVASQKNATLTDKLIPIFAFHSKNRRCHSHSGDTGTLDNYLGWCYPYYVGSTAGSVLPELIPSNIVTGYNNVFGSKIRTTFTIDGLDPVEEAGSKVPILVLDMNNGQRSSNGDGQYLADTWKKPYAEGFIVDKRYVLPTGDTETTQFITGCEFTRGVAPETTSEVDRDSLPAPDRSLAYVQSWGENEIHFVGNRGIIAREQPNWSSAQYSMACGVAFFLDATASSASRRSFYTTGSWGISQLFPQLSTVTKTINFYGLTDSDKESGTVYVNDPYGNNSYGWPVEGDDTPSWIKRTGYKLTGWYTSRQGWTKVSANKMVRTSTPDPINLYAHWEALRYKLTYNINGGEPVTPEEKFGVYDQPWGELATTTRVGYTFKGWYTAKSGGTQVTSSTICKGDITVYAQWDVIPYTITYDPNGGSMFSTTQNYDIETDLILKSAPARSGYTFGNWKVTTASGNWNRNALFEDEELVGVGKYGKPTLTAQWFGSGYVATFKPNGGTWVDDSSTEAQTVNFTTEDALTLPSVISRTGYTFDGWKITTRSGNWPEKGTSYNINNTTTAFDGTPGRYGNVSFTAQWIQNSYTIAWNLGEGGIFEDGFNYLRDSGNYTYLCNPQGVINYHTYDYTPTDGHSRNSYFRVMIPVRTGYVFTGWNITGMDSTPHNYYIDTNVEFSTTTLNTSSLTNISPPMRHLRATSGTVLFTALWEAKPVVVSFDVNVPSESKSQVASADKPLPKTVSYGSTYGSLPSLTNKRTGYSFDGWYTAAKGGIEVLSSTVVSTESNHTLYAHWTAQEYEVEFNSRGGSAVDSIPFTVEDIPLLIREESERDGFEFLGWSTSTTGSPASKPYRITTFTSSNIILYAGWKLGLKRFIPKPGEPSVEQEYFGVPIDDLDPDCMYSLSLKVVGDRRSVDGKSLFVLQDYEGRYEDNRPFSWVNDITYNNKTKFTPTELQDALDAHIVFPMDVWRCRIFNQEAKLQVTLVEHYSDNTSSTSKNTEGFVIYDDCVPQVNSASTHEGVENIRVLDLSANNTTSTKRFIGNAKSSVLLKFNISSKTSSDVEKLYDAVPCGYKSRIDYSGTPQEGSDWYQEVGNDFTDNLIDSFILQDYDNITLGSRLFVSENVICTEIPFPCITDHLSGARVRIRVSDTRHRG